MQQSAQHEPRVAVLDLDGTLVDSVPVHVLAWQAAFRDVGLEVPSHRIRGAIGVGGDRIVEMLAGSATEAALGDELRDRHPHHLDVLFDRVIPTEGATRLLQQLKQHGYVTVVASSGDLELTERLLALVPESRSLIDELLGGSDVESSKPDGELVERALDAAGSRRAVVVGDAVWDVRSAHDADVPCVGLLTGGACASELTEVGAAWVAESPDELADHLDSTGRLLA